MEVTPEQVAERMGYSLAGPNPKSVHELFLKGCERIAELENEMKIQKDCYDRLRNIYDPRRD